MSNEIAAITEESSSAISVLPPQQPPSLAAQQMLMAHAEMMQTAYDLASKMVPTDLVPSRFKLKAEDATAAILYGAELGLNPIQSLQRIVPIHGMPTLEARTMVALVKSRGYKVKTIAQSDESVTVQGRDPDDEVYESTWTIERAHRAGYVPTPSSDDSLKRPDVQDDWVTVTKTWNGKTKTSVVGNMKYITDPQAMLKAKAQAEVCRDMAPEILLGISYTTEEMESERFEPPAREPQQAGRAAPITVEEILNEPDTGAGGEPGQGGGNDASQGAEPSSGATPQADSRDQAGGKPMSAQTRRKWLNRMFQLLSDGDCADKDDQLIVISATLDAALSEAGQPEPKLALEHRDALTDDQLRDVVTLLNVWEKAGRLGSEITEILNRAALVEMEAETSAAAGDAEHAEADAESATEESAP